MRRISCFFATLLVSLAASAAGLDAISNRDAVSGLKQALTDGSAAAVSLLGAENGFLGNAKVKIPLPPAIQQVEGALRLMGGQQQADRSNTTRSPDRAYRSAWSARTKPRSKTTSPRKRSCL